MTRNEINRGLCAILTTLAEMPDRSAPEGPMYAALNQHGTSLDDFALLRNIMVVGGLIAVENDVQRLTPKGIDMAHKISNQLASR